MITAVHEVAEHAPNLHSANQFREKVQRYQFITGGMARLGSVEPGLHRGMSGAAHCA